jgi:hypothetical protein
MLDYKNIIIKPYVLHMTGREIAEALQVSQSGVNGFLREFKRCKTLSFPLPEGITNLGVFNKVYPNAASVQIKHDERYELPDFGEIHQRMASEKNMTLADHWGKYTNRCVAVSSMMFLPEYGRDVFLSHNNNQSFRSRG